MLWLVHVFAKTYGYILFVKAYCVQVALNQNKMYLARSLNLVSNYIYIFFSLKNSWLRDYFNSIFVLELALKDTTNTARSAPYLELHSTFFTVRVVWERNYLTKEMVPQYLSSDCPYTYLISYIFCIFIVFSIYFICCGYLYSNKIISIQLGTFNDLSRLYYL